jgi:hypothetical protein
MQQGPSLAVFVKSEKRMESFLDDENLFDLFETPLFTDDTDLCMGLDQSAVTSSTTQSSRKRYTETIFSLSSTKLIVTFFFFLMNRKSSYIDSDSEQSSRIGKARKGSKSLPVVAPTKYANYLVSAINEHDTNRLKTCLQQICTEDAKVNLNIYNVKDFQKGKKVPTNHFGDFQTANLCLDDFIRMQKSMNVLVPDGFMELTSSKCCFESTGSSVYISCFQMKGTIISKDSRIATGDEKGNLVGILPPNSAILKSSALSKYVKPFVAEGSMIMYRSESGKMTGIEFYYEFSQ